MNEAQDIEAIARGDHIAFERIATRYLPIILRYAQRILDNSSAAEDIAQETLIVLWLKAEQFNPAKSQLTTWLHTIAHNKCTDYWRAQQRVMTLSESKSKSEDSHNDHLEVSAPADSEVDGQYIRKWLQSLPPRQRHALVLTYYQSLSNKEVGEVMGLGVRAVESLLVRARTAMKERLGEDYDRS